MENISVNELNAVLKGEQMAVDAYDRFIKAADDKDIKDELMNMQLDHQRHIGKISERISNLGGQPETGTGFVGILSNARLAIETLQADSLDILKKAYDGEDQGIAAVEEIIKGDLDDDSRVLVEGILSQDHDHLKKMAQMIAFYEENKM